MGKREPPKIAWISDFPVEWLEPSLRGLPPLARQHPATWQMVLLEELEKEQDLQLHVVVLRKGIPSSFSVRRGAVQFHIVRVPGKLRAPSFFWVDTLLIRKCLRAVQPDLVHAWGTERGAGLIAARLPHPHVVTVQGLMTWYRQVVPVNTHERMAAFIERVCFRRPVSVTTESQFAVQFLRSHYPLLDIHQIEHAPNRLFHSVKRIPSRDRLRLLSVGNIGFRKGTDILLQALDRCSAQLDFELILVGGQNRAELGSLMDSCSAGLKQRITYIPQLGRQELVAEYSKASLFMLSTRADTSPNAVKEAAVAGVPVVATPVGGIPDYIFPGLNGVLAQDLSVDSFTRAIQEACANPEFRNGVVDGRTLARVRGYLSPETMAQKFRALYQWKLLLKPGGEPRGSGHLPIEK